MRFMITAFLLFLAGPALAAMNCGTRTTPVAADFADCVSPDYDPALSLVDGTALTSDEYARLQWNMRMVLEGETYSSLFSDAPRDVKVAVIDTWPGHQNHPDLVNRYETGINTVERDGQGNPTTNTNPATIPSLQHGQQVASVIAAEHNNSGIAGVFHRARIIPVRASFDTLDEAIDLAVTAGAEVIHIAGWEIDYTLQDYALYPDVGLPTNHPLRWMMKDATTAAYEKGRLVAIREAIERATWDENVIISTVIANWDGRATTHFLSGHHETLSTMAVNILGEPSPLNSNSHSAVILAPGGDRRVKYFSSQDIAPIGTVPSDCNDPQSTQVSEFYGPDVATNPDDIPVAWGCNRFTWASGGSFAGPHVAAAAAIIKSYLPNATPQDVKRLLTRSKQPIMLNLHVLQGVGGMLSVKRLKAGILAE